MTIKLSVLDQSLAQSPDSAAQALQETLAMAQWCEQLGYHRFWVSEHHAFPSVAGSAPEVLIAALGAATEHIRLGSGGIMLPHYSPYKMAEVFSLLANLYPGRIDLGVGRAPGADMSTAMALAANRRPNFEQFPRQVAELCDYLWRPVSEPIVSPKPTADQPVWMLGSSIDSALLAAERGLPYNLAAFINPQAAPDIVAYYRQRFQANTQPDYRTEQLQAPYAILTISVFCADTEARARLLQLTHDINLFRFFTGQSTGAFLTPEQAEHYEISQQLAAFIASRDDSRAVGTPQQVRQRVATLAKRFDVDEIMAVTNMYYLDDRKRSFELLKQAFV
ncbi:Flavin-dependent trigonelline monooxygenase, oxygenase component [Sinobacterium norvegicum]|uniref:Flavin-dependent trigonelline monooxygenase, oxygenase component n=1 Tax=Sinobacterium norvegicum TaxID=1641715 RepID=A0ABN8EFU2_9GAMM|nr:LLM class flavin-dependent oxidoreductase [Sinobacterium norvegicum]CAH0991280.1 Flavin-dependent trigonelline monooxygenase, oxygenase component [Sinobacterium norvegicum]